MRFLLKSCRYPLIVSDSFAWILRDGGKDVAVRIATSATLIWVVMPRVPLIIDALIVFVVVLMLLGPGILGFERLLRGVRFGGSAQPSEPSNSSRNASFVLIAVLVAAMVAGGSVYVVGDQVAQRRIQEERREFAEKQARLQGQQARLQKEKRIEERIARRRRQAIETKLAQARMRAARLRISDVVERARQEYWSWESLLLRYYEPQRATREIMKEVGHDVHNIAVAGGRVQTGAEAKAVGRDIRRWVRLSAENRRLIESGASRYYPARFVLSG